MEASLSSLSESDQAVVSTAVADLLRVRAERTGSRQDLSRAIALNEKALSISTLEDDPYLPGRLGTLANLLQTRFEWTGSAEDLDRTITLERRALALINETHPEFVDHVNNLSDALRSRFDHGGLIEDLDEAITKSEQAVSMTSIDNPLLAAYLTNLSNALQRRFEQKGSLVDLDTAIKKREQSIPMIPAGHPNLPACLGNLGNALHKRFEQTGSIEDLDRAVEINERAVNLTSKNDPLYPRHLNGFGTVLHTRYDQTGSMNDLERSIKIHTEAVDSTPSTFHTFPVHLTSLGNALYVRYERKGSTEDLDQAIKCHEKAVANTSNNDTNLVQYLNNLSNTLEARFNRLGSKEDLDRAIIANEKVVDSTNDGHFELPMYLNNLGSRLHKRFSRTGSMDDLDRAIEMKERAVALTPLGHFTLPMHLSNLAITFLTRFKATAVSSDLDLAIANMEQAISIVPITSPNYASYLNNLGTVLKTQFESSESSMTVLDHAITTFERAVAMTQPDHPNLTVHLNNLAGALRGRFERTGLLDDLERSVASNEQAMANITGRPSDRIAAADAASRLLIRRDNHRARRLLRSAIKLLPSLSPRILQHRDQQYNLSEVAGLTSRAVAVSLECNDDPYSALRLSELGRGILASLQLEVKSDISTLRTADPDLAQRFKDIRYKLNQSEGIFNNFLSIDFCIDSDPERRRDLAKQFDTMLNSIRAIEGFQQFLLGPSKFELLTMAEAGSIVIFNVNEIRSDAIIVNKEDIRSLPLPLLTYTELIAQINLFLDAMRASLKNYSGPKAIGRILEWLWDAAVGPALTELGFIQVPPGNRGWPRVWWVSSGLLNWLPIHAAGYHESKSSPPNTAIDRVISSYTPTIKALAYARERKQGIKTSLGQNAALIGMPKTPDLKDLPFVESELKALQELLPSQIQTTVVQSPTRDKVLSTIRDHQVVHFACHGLSSVDPAQSKLALTDWKTMPLTVLDLTALNVQSGQFAYLSACHTANTRDVRLLDESINLASAIQLAGYPSVVGTLWTVSDQHSAEVAREVYASMLVDDHGFKMDPQKAASGLHWAARRLRDDTRTIPGFSRKVPSNPHVWAPYIHLGI